VSASDASAGGGPVPAAATPSEWGSGAPDGFDPEAVPIRPAATVMVVEDRPDLRVLMLRRTARAVFAGDMWVYPGGRVDPDDAEGVLDHVTGLTDAAASAALGIDHGGLAFWVAALRECFEEAGILLARDSATGAPLDLRDAATAARLEPCRAALNAGQRGFADIVAELGVVLDASQVHYVGHWVTPLGSPRRFDTRFFLAAPPPDQTAVHDDTEIVHHEWVSPAAAIEAWRADRMAMMTPTARMLMSLLPFERAADVVTAAAAERPLDQVRVQRDGETYHIMLPGDAGYDDGDPDLEFGWVKLRP
jgi:8-oxo-dGTP pyrophosphatase MutT (NUDIX family)